MQTLIHADIFFFVSTIALVIISISITIALIFVILILKNLRQLSETVNAEAGHIAEDMKDIRAKAHSFSWIIAFQLFRKFFIKFIKRNK